ncbi:uncharacterized protein BXZ73DRAFT_76671 [Epithele typhae]|uniref:uncharacterized protein n=1 Tax=Epithele typhae TaxID=378194 RepID=UPI002007DFDD|nr:uncharacterized protein BXZ73DRAFT_76671 [Epithele typhae]KAH9936882.1 hypothetical protein BXZ73DRAFT_76671 [Epithele typhae]
MQKTKDRSHSPELLDQAGHTAGRARGRGLQSQSASRGRWRRSSCREDLGRDEGWFCQKLVVALSRGRIGDGAESWTPPDIRRGRSDADEEEWRENWDESEARRECSGAGEGERRGLGGMGLAARCGPPGEGLRVEEEGEDESAASLSNRERRLLTAGGAAVSIPSTGSPEDMAKNRERLVVSAAGVTWHPPHSHYLEVGATSTLVKLSGTY